MEYIRNDDEKYADALEDFRNAHGNIALNLGADPSGVNVVPVPPAKIDVQVLDNLLDVSITDKSDVSRSIDYYIEYGTDPAFNNPRIEHLGPSRNRTIAVPQGTWYVQVRTQYRHGGPPSVPVRHPVGIVVSTGPVGVLLPSQGAGTGGGGAGKTITRKAIVR